MKSCCCCERLSTPEVSGVHRVSCCSASPCSSLSLRSSYRDERRIAGFGGGGKLSCMLAKMMSNARIMTSATQKQNMQGQSFNGFGKSTVDIACASLRHWLQIFALRFRDGNTVNASAIQPVLGLKTRSLLSLMLRAGRNKNRRKSNFYSTKGCGYVST